MEQLQQMFGLTGRKILVIGGTGAIGRATLEALAKAGAQVIPTSRTKEKADEAARAASAYGPLSPGGVALEITDFESIKRAGSAVRELLGSEPLDGLVLNAGGQIREALVTPGKHVWDATPELGAQVLRLNLEGPWAALCQFLPLMVSAPSPTVVLVGSQSPIGLSRGLHYRIAKAGLEQIGQFLALHLPLQENPKFRVVTARPGFVESEQNSFSASDPVRYNAIVDHTPQARWGTAREIAEPIAFLFSDAASYCNGASLVFDGGFAQNRLGNKAV